VPVVEADISTPASGAGRRFVYPAGSLGALLLLAVIWGGSVPFIKLGLRDFPPLTLTALRYLVAAPFFVFLLLGRRFGGSAGRHDASHDIPRHGASGAVSRRGRGREVRRLPRPSGLARAAALGLLGIGVGQVAQTLGVRQTSASVATVISATIPILVVVFAAIRLHQPVPARQAAGLGVAFVGVVLVATGDPRRLRDLLATPALGGDLLVVLSALAISLYYVLSVELIAESSVITVAALTSLAGAGALVPAALWELRTATVTLTAGGVAVVLYLAVLVTVVGMVIWLHALRHLPASLVAVLQYLQPLVGVGASAALFGDPLRVWFGIGTGLVLLGIAWSTAAGPGLPASRPPASTGCPPGA
jgi:O-acetylserine/cysteine efflux transporter